MSILFTSPLSRKAGKKKVKQETDYQLIIPGMKSRYDYNSGKNIVTGELTLAESAEGNWVTAVFDEAIELVDFKKATGVKGLKHSADFKGLKPGKYAGGDPFRRGDRREKTSGLE